MKTFNEHNIDEALITFGGKAYPKSGHVVILAGGAGSGKGFILNKLLGIEGKVFDVDMVKSLSLKRMDFLDRLAKRTELLYKEGKLKQNYDIYDLAAKKELMSQPELVRIVHAEVADTKLDKRIHQSFFQSLVTLPPERLPNIIFDVTLRDYIKLINLSNSVTTLGYDKKNIHIVWVINDIEVARKQNIERGKKKGGRTVDDDILFYTHKGASITMSDIISDSEKTQKYADGSIVIAFNQEKVDATVKETPKGSFKGPVEGKKNINILKAFYVRIKDQGKPVDVSKVNAVLLKKIVSYVPKDTFKIDNDNK